MLVLGSGSEARKKLLCSVGLIPDRIVVPNIDEYKQKKELPLSYVKRVAKEKSMAIDLESDSYLITADTIVTLGREVLNRTDDRVVAKEHLNRLSGRRHHVYTSFCIRHKQFFRNETVKTQLKMKNLSNDEIDKYISSDEWLGKAGSYSIQGTAISFFPFISGCFSNVIGLPLPKLINVLKAMDFY